MTSYLSSWWPSFSRAEEVVATDTTTEDKDLIEVDSSSSRQESPLVSTTNDTSNSAETEESATGTTTTTNNQNPTPNGPAGPSRPEKKDTFKVPALPTSRPPSQSIASTSSLIPPPIPSRQGPAPIARPRKEEDIDAAPQFPLPDSAQRSRPAAPSVLSFDVRPPSPDQEDEDEPASDLNIAILPGTVPLGNMAPPPSTTARPAFGMQKGAEQPSKAKRREKVALGPGYSPLDWARLTQSGRNLRGVEGPKRVTLEELSQHSSQYDAWMALDGIVYNITPYVRFHPGGGKELLRGAGRDGTKLFMNTHSWVNYTHMLQECIIGPLVRK